MCKNNRCLWCKKVFPAKNKHMVIRKYCSLSCGTKYRNKGYIRKGPQYIEARDFIYEDKVRKGCSRCTERRPNCLEYHHLDRSTKVAAVSRLMYHSLSTVVEEISKCILLCSNCHKVETWGDGYRQDYKFRGDWEDALFVSYDPLDGFVKELVEGNTETETCSKQIDKIDDLKQA